MEDFRSQLKRAFNRPICTRGHIAPCGTRCAVFPHRVCEELLYSSFKKCSPRRVLIRVTPGFGQQPCAGRQIERCPGSSAVFFQKPCGKAYASVSYSIIFGTLRAVLRGACLQALHSVSDGVRGSVNSDVGRKIARHIRRSIFEEFSSKIERL